MSFHAKLSPSAAHRWMNCAGSVALIGDEPSSSGPAAWLGTAVHKLIEHLILSQECDASEYRGWLVFVHKPGREETVLQNSVTEIPAFANPSEWQMFVLRDTEINGAQTHIDEVNRVMDTLFEPEIFSERYLDMTWLDSRFGGTADTTVIAMQEPIHLFDYKNGRVVVEVKDNEQFLSYGVGLLHEHPEAPGVKVHLVQPNATHEDGIIREMSYSRAEILAFQKEMKKAADATSKPNAPLRAGEWCMYCQAKTRCKGFEAMAEREAGLDFASDPPEKPPAIVDEDVSIVDDEDGYRAGLARRARWMPLIDQWTRDIRAAIARELMSGAGVPGWKLVRGRSNRKWDDGGNEDAFLQTLSEATEIGRESLYNVKLKSPLQVEKMGSGPETKKLIKDAVARLAVKPLGKLSIAPTDDDRAGINPVTLAAEDFADDPVEEVT